MKNTKGESGITLVSVILTFIILIIIASIVIPRISDISATQDINNLKQDLELLQDKVNIYYQKEQSLPIVGGVITAVPSTLLENKNQNDNGNYYKIDTSSFGTIKLNLGLGDDGDYYIVNEQSHQVYYFKGIVSNGQTIHAINTDSSDITGEWNNYTTISFGFNTQVSDNNITVTAEVVSNITGYSYKLDNQEWTDFTTDNTYTFTDVTYAKHTISVKIKDNAGNEIYSKDNPSEITVI